MSYRREDHWPRPIRNCRTCGRDFEAESWYQRECNDCAFDGQLLEDDDREEDKERG